MNPFRWSTLAGIALIALLACSTAQAQTRVVVTTQPGFVNSPYFLPMGYSFSVPNYYYAPYSGQGAGLPGSPGTIGGPPLPTQFYFPPDPYYPYYNYYPAQYGYVPSRGVRSNWKLDNMRSTGGPYRR